MKVAVVGSGVSGLGATWLLNEHSDHEVHLYESDSRPGGHANTVKYHPPGNAKSEGVNVDTGFIVCNPATYPNFLRFAALHAPKQPDGPGIKIIPTEMTFSVSRNGGNFEWAGKNLFTVFCQPRRLLDPHMWRMIYDVLRFNACAPTFLMRGLETSIGGYLDKKQYSVAFRDNYLIPMTAAIWSTPPGKCFLDFPAKTLIQFMYNHHLLQITGKPSWLTIEGGSHNYVNKIINQLPQDQLHLNTPVVSITTKPSSESTSRPNVVLRTQDGTEAEYDHVIMACHSDTALQILRAGNITHEEGSILGMFEWNKNEVVLHSDPALMPRSRLAWSCWNYLTTSLRQSDSDIDRVSLTYGMNDLQHISEAKWGPVLVTLNPPFRPADDKTFGWWKYDHPVLDAKAVQAQAEIHKIQNKRSITFAGAYLKYGFHEDGFTSGLIAACALDEEHGSFPHFSKDRDTLTIPVQHRTVKPPFEIQYADHHLALQRKGLGPVQAGVVAMFWILEASGLRGLVGMAGSLVLNTLSLLLGLQSGQL